MYIRFTPRDTSLPFAGLEAPLVTVLDMPLDDIADMLRAIGWKLSEFDDYQNRMLRAAHQKKAIKAGATFDSLIETTSDDEITQQKLMYFATLRAAGHKVTWAQVGRLSPRETDFIAEPGDGLVEALGDDDSDRAEQDPTTTSTDSVPAVDVTSPDLPDDGPR